MKLLHVVATYLPAVRHGGPPRAIHGLGRALVERGHRVEVFTTDLHADGRLDVPIGQPTDLDGVAVTYFRATRPRRLARAPEMAQALGGRIAEFDVVHLHGLFLWPMDAAARAAERVGVPWIVSPRGMLVDELLEARGRWRKRLWLVTSGRRTLGGARRLIATSELEAQQAAATGVRIPPVELLANGVERPAPAEASALPNEVATFLASGPTFVFLGRLSWKKGLERLIEAVAQVPAARLVLAGNDDEGIGPALDQLAHRLGTSDRVLRSGFVDGAAKSALLAQARALVLPSISENFGNVVLEAWALATPVVVAPGVGLAGEVADAGAGLVEDGRVDGLVASLGRLLADSAEAQAMGERGRRRVAERFAWAQIAERAEAIYRQVADEVAR